MQEAQFTVCLNKIWNKDLILTIDFEEHSWDVEETSCITVLAMFTLTTYIVSFNNLRTLSWISPWGKGSNISVP